MFTNFTLFRFACRIKMHEQRRTRQKDDDKTPEGAVPAYLLDREGQNRAKVLSNMIKQKRKEKAVSSALCSKMTSCLESVSLIRGGVVLVRQFTMKNSRKGYVVVL